MTKQEMKVTKRDGSIEMIDLDKIHKVVSWAAEGLENVSVSQVELKAQIQFYNGVTTKDIHNTLIKSAADLISEETPDYQYLAARLAIFQLRKIAYGEFTPPHLHQHVKRMVEMGKYDNELLNAYTETEYDELNNYINHDRDMDLAYVAVKQMEGKYLVQDRTTGRVFESPQFLFMLVGVALFVKEDKSVRMSLVKKFYDTVSTFKVTLPSPVMNGVRTPTKQFASCCLIEAEDSLDSINGVSNAVVNYISQRAGIGINGGAIRALGSPIRGGEAVHTGIIPFWKLFQTAVKSCSQGAMRGGAATVFYPLWHLEVESLLVLKNNRGVEENRIRQMDYGVQINKTLYTRLIKNGNITLFSPNEVPGLYEAFFADQEEFERLYTQYEADESIRKKVVPAVELFSTLMQERASTGRIYIHNVDHTNTHSAFDPKQAPIRQSNLCLEITLPTKPISAKDPSAGEIALCTLSAINLGTITELSELEDIASITVRALDNLLDYQDYPVEAARKSTMYRRTLGVGVINFAYYLTKNGRFYSNGSGNNLTHRTFEAIQYYLLKASMNLAKERGACPGFHETTYSQGILPIDTYKKDIDKLTNEPLHLDWETLRSEIKEFGLRNSTLSALMPSESSSQVANATNGIESPRGLVSVKASKDGILKQVVPDFKELKYDYELLWEFPDNEGYLQLVGIMQKFVDQAISANTSYDPAKFPDGKVPMKQLLKDLLTAYKYGLKTLYYHNTRDGADDTQSSLDDGCAGGACKI